MNLPPACNPSACRASGRGLQPKGLRVKEVADLKVYTKGSGSGELKVAVKGPSKKPSDKRLHVTLLPLKWTFFYLNSRGCC